MKHTNLLAIALLALLCLTATCSSKKHDQICQTVLITVKDSTQIQFLKADDVRQILANSRVKLKGKPIAEINADSVENILLKNSAVKKVECYRTSSGSELRIDLWQREPLFRVMGSRNYYVDVEGIIIATSGQFVAHVPVVTGNVNSTFAVGELKNFILFLRSNEFWQSQITQIDVGEGNQIVLIPRAGKHEIEFGTLDRYEQKLDKLKTFYLEGLNKIGWDTYRKINIKYKDQVVCTK